MRYVLYGFLLLAAAGCGQDNAGGGDGAVKGSDGSSGGDASAATDGSGGSDAGDAATTGTDGSGGGGTPDLAVTCPAYQALCNGACIPTSVDPKNCGGCGITCPAGQACSSSKCESSCLPGLTICDGACVDTMSDSQNCGGCGKACPSGKGCAEGSCINAVPVGPAPSMCVGGGPPINVPIPGQATCAGNLAQVTFPWALCSCKDVALSDTFVTDAYDSSKGPYMAPGGPGAGVGLDGRLDTSSSMSVSGALWASATGGINASAQTTIHEELHSGGPLGSSAQCRIDDDAYVAGNVSGNVTIKKTLYQPQGTSASGGVTYAARVVQPVTVPPPCDCSQKALIPVAAIVAAARTTNDNAKINLAPGALAGGSGPSRLDLPCGSYYLDAIRNSSATVVVAHGHTALYIGGDINTSSPLTITLDPTAELDVFVGGTISTSDTLKLGSPNYPALMRVYVGGTGAISFSSGVTIAANLYAATAPVDYSSAGAVYGALFVGDFSSSSAVEIHYDRQVVNAGVDCPKPGGSSGGSDGGTSGGSDGGGGPPTACGSCKDCGNQACVNGACGSCSSSAQCCAPLVCYQGSCILPIN